MRTRTPVLAAILGAVLVVSACGGDDDEGATSTSTTGAAPAGPTSTESAVTNAGAAPATSAAAPTGSVVAAPKPTGDPIVLAMISQESGPGALPDARLAAEAAVAYVNKEVGGAGGRPLQLETCITDGSPEQSSGCANRLLEKHPVAFVGEFEVGTTGSMPIIERAGVPRIGPAAVTPELIQSPDSFAMGLDLVPGWSSWTEYLTTELGAKKVNFIAIDFSGGPVIQQIVKSVAEANGAKMGATSVYPQTATDVSPQMAAVIGGSPDVIVAVPSGSTCVPLMQSHQSLAADVPLFLPGICGDPRILAAAGDAGEGTYIGFSRLNPYDTSDPEVATYRRALDTYATEKVALSEFASNSFAAVVNVKALIDSLGADITPAALKAAVAATVDQPNFMGEPYSCAQPHKLTPATCANSQRMLQVKDGALVDVGGAWFDGTAKATLG
jgi:branched-chain amino acid transport system substrate-binding protein